MNTSTQRVPRDPEGELISPNWRRKPLHVLVAEAVANNRALLERLEGGLYSPPVEVNHHTPKMAYDLLGRTLREQIKALKTFSGFDWTEVTHHG
jgi:hypothetical protein